MENDEILSERTEQIEGYTVTLAERRVKTRNAVPWDPRSRDEWRVGWHWTAPSPTPGYVISEPRDYDTAEEAVDAARRRLWIDRHIGDLPGQSLTRDEYESRCAAAGVEAIDDAELLRCAYAMEHGDFWMGQYPPAKTVAGVLAQSRYRALVAAFEAVRHPGTQADQIQDPLIASLGHVVDGELYKPDAHPESRGPCTVCGSPGVWISGAGEHLCARHQDEY